MYCQLELETVAGTIFQGPFVFRLEDGIEKLSRLGWLTKTRNGNGQGILKLVEILDFPRASLWKALFDDESGERHLNRVKQAEFAWKAFFVAKEKKGEGENA